MLATGSLPDDHHLEREDEDNCQAAAQDEEARKGRQLLEVGNEQEGRHESYHDEAVELAVLAALVRLLQPLAREQVRLPAQVHTLSHRK